uniref:T9SS type B sorting domain-containing protein n=1 Tax=Fluviicola sp. TaxID=1917219 RepID=UPI0040490C30
MKKLLFLLFLVLTINGYAQLFPNPATLSTGQGAIGTFDPIWLVSPWYPSSPPNPLGLPYTPALINNNCAPGAWVNPASLPAPVNNGNWITGNDANCANNTVDGYRYFRLTLDLPPDCNGSSVAVNGNYILYLSGYVDNSITDVFVNGTSLGISGGNYSAGTQLNMTLPGPWVPGINYLDILIYNIPNGGGNPYGLLLVANSAATANTDTDGDGISDINDLCPCEAGFASNGCPPPITPSTQICLGESTTIEVATAGTFLWSNGETTGTIVVTPNATTTYTCTITYPNSTQESLSSTVTVLPSYNTTISQLICEGETFLFAGNPYNQTGNYSVINQTVNGCDSISNLNLTVNPIYTETVNQSICQGETVNFEGTSYSTAGTYQVTLNSSQGCDSVRILNLTVLNTSSSSLNVVECGQYAWNSQNYTTSGSYTFTTLNSNGCDSVAQLNLTIHPIYQVTIDTALCQGESYTNNGTTFNQTGNYTIPLQTINGCDSTISINLIVYPIPAAPILTANQPECPGEQLQLAAITALNSELFWQGPSNFYSSNNPISVLASNATIGLYLAFSIANGCVSDTSFISTSILNPEDFEGRDFPNVLTPNNDFINENFNLKEIYQSCLAYELRIYNRWGLNVYLQTNDTAPFDGKTQDGMELTEGIYFYKLTYDGGQKTGFFHILR